MQANLFPHLLLALASTMPAFGQEHAGESGDAPAADWRVRPRLEAQSEAIAPNAQRTSVDYRWWAGNQRFAFGAGIGAVNYSFAAPTAGIAPDPARPFTQVVGPVLTLGWRMRLGSATLSADTSTLPMPPSDDLFQSQVPRGSVPWKTTQRRLGLDRGSFALQLDSGYRLSLRPRRGGLALTLRGSF